MTSRFISPWGQKSSLPPALNCVSDLKTWTKMNFLNLNEIKTEVDSFGKSWPWLQFYCCSRSSGHTRGTDSSHFLPNYRLLPRWSSSSCKVIHSGLHHCSDPHVVVGQSSLKHLQLLQKQQLIFKEAWSHDSNLHCLTVWTFRVLNAHLQIHSSSAGTRQMFPDIPRSKGKRRTTKAEERAELSYLDCWDVT